MYKKFKQKIDSFLSREVDKKSKYENIYKELNKKIKKLKDKNDKQSLQEIKSLEKLKKKTKLMIDSLK